MQDDDDKIDRNDETRIHEPGQPKRPEAVDQAHPDAETIAPGGDAPDPNAKTIAPGGDEAPVQPNARTIAPGGDEAPVRPDTRTVTSSSEPEGFAEGLKEFAHYKLLKELGRGAQGVVFLAEDKRLRRKVALKMLAGAAAQSRSTRERFQREAEAASKLDHPGICGIHEMGEEEGIPYIAMQYVRGTALSDMVESAKSSQTLDATVCDISQSLTGEVQPEQPGTAKKPTSSTGYGRTAKPGPSNVVYLIEKAARALHVAHEAGLIHRDIKPGNMMITPEGDPVILDFGLARDLDTEGQTLTQSGALLGTPAYMAVEQIFEEREHTDRRVDIYALGVTLYECLTLQRPFDGATLEQLFQKIRSATPTNPRKLNPRIPQDLRTVTETAMERDRRHRYQTALAFAEDLRRVRSYEPIQAKAAGPIKRTWKWARRNPAKAVSVAAVLLFVLGGAGLIVGQQMAQKSEDLATAATLRNTASAKQLEYAGLREGIRTLDDELAAERDASFSRYAPGEVRAGYWSKQQEREELDMQAETVLEESRRQLVDAARLEAKWGESTMATEAALADLYFTRWEEAVRSGDPAREASLRSTVESYDHEGRYADQLLGRGILTAAVTPPNAEVYLFRYEQYTSLRPTNPIPRLVPVPTAGIGRVKPDAWVEDFYPGDLCLEITDVNPGSPAADSGLRTGDLIIRLNGAPCGDGLFLRQADGVLAAAGIVPLTKVESRNGVVVEAGWDFTNARGNGRGGDSVVFGGGVEVNLDAGQLRLRTPRAVIENVAEVDMQLFCLRGGEPVVVKVPAGDSAGITCRPTAYPLILAEENRIIPGAELAIDPGSYLLLVRSDGFEDQRFPIVVPRGDQVLPEVTLLENGTTPPGFVYIPAGPYLSGGDRDAFRPAPQRAIDVDAFFIAEQEFSNREWFAWLNLPETLARIEEMSQQGRPELVPRESSQLFAEQSRDGGRWEPSVIGPSSPVAGVTRRDVQVYLDWRNERAEAQGEPWIYDLPTPEEWEKAARGVDGRFFPWGNEFDFSLTVGQFSKPTPLFSAPSGLQLRDQSPYGLLDTAGLRQEWTRDLYQAEGPLYHTRGGNWGGASPGAFRSARRDFANEGFLSAQVGFRLVLRPR